LFHVGGMGGNGFRWQNAENGFCSEVEPFERAIGRVHGRRLLCAGWQNEWVNDKQKYSSKKRFVNSRSAVTSTRAT
jgi:hypothetical protein